MDIHFNLTILMIKNGLESTIDNVGAILSDRNYDQLAVRWPFSLNIIKPSMEKPSYEAVPRKHFD